MNIAEAYWPNLTPEQRWQSLKAWTNHADELAEALTDSALEDGPELLPPDAYLTVTALFRAVRDLQAALGAEAGLLADDPALAEYREQVLALQR